MNCTTCNSILIKIEKIESLTYRRLNKYFCHNKECLALTQINSECYYECNLFNYLDEYYLPFYYLEEWFILCANSKFMYFYNYKDIHMKNSLKINKIPILFDIHFTMNAWKIFHKLYKLAIFS